jgi:hypothetical protein
MAAITRSGLGTGLEVDRVLSAAERRRLLTMAALLLEGIVNFTADIPFPGIFLDTHVPKYRGLADR